MTRKRSYVFSQHGGGDNDSSAGNYCYKSGMVSSWSPPYENGVLTFRIFPGLSAEDRNKFDPYRWPSDDQQDPLGFGDWIRGYPAVRGAGAQPTTFFYNDPANPIVEDIRMTPAWVLRNAVETAIRQKVDRPGWAALVTGRRPTLPKPSTLYVLQGCVVVWRNKVFSPPRGLSPRDKTVIIQLSPSAFSAFMQQCNLENPNYTGALDDWESRYTNGDPISLETGRFVTIYTLSDGDPRLARAQQASRWQSQMHTQAQTFGAAQEQKPIGYGCYMEPSFGSIPARFSDYESYVRAKVQPWNDIIHVPTLEQQAHLLADKFPPDVICYAWLDSHPEWVPEDIRRKAVGARQVAVGGFIPAGPSSDVPQAAGGPAAWPTQFQSQSAPPPMFGNLGAVPVEQAADQATPQPSNMCPVDSSVPTAVPGVPGAVTPAENLTATDAVPAQPALPNQWQMPEMPSAPQQPTPQTPTQAPWGMPPAPQQPTPQPPWEAPSAPQQPTPQAFAPAADQEQPLQWPQNTAAPAQQAQFPPSQPELPQTAPAQPELTQPAPPPVSQAPQQMELPGMAGVTSNPATPAGGMSTAEQALARAQAARARQST